MALILYSILLYMFYVFLLILVLHLILIALFPFVGTETGIGK